MPMKEEILSYIKEKDMLQRGDRVVTGVSGGADSVCLLHVLWCLKSELGIELAAVHIHHGLRGEEADRDAAFTADFCKKLNVPCEIVYINAKQEARELGISVEEAGRIARYRILEEAAGSSKNSLIAVAHHGDDNAETILHNLFRGSGLKGLGGIPPVRGRIIRPLLWAERSEIIDYLSEEKLSFVDDTTNFQNDYTRNKLRNQILPLIIKEVNEKAVKNILRAGNMMEAADEYFEKRSEEWMKRQDSKKSGGLSVAELIKEEEIIRGYIIRLAIRQLGCSLKDLTARHIEDILSLTDRQTGKQIILPGGLIAEREYDMICLYRDGKGGIEKKPNLPVLHKRIFFCGDMAEIQQEIPKNQYTKWFDYDRIQGTLSVRFRQTGDYIALPDGKRKTVKAFMIDEKIPATLRGAVPLLTEGNHVLWIIGYRISEYYKVTEHTKNILEVRLDGGLDGGR